MTIMALATGLQRSNITHLQWERIDMARCCCYVPGYETKAGEPIPVPLNADAMAVLERWKIIHEAMRGLWPADAHRYVFVFRGHAPIQQVTTAMWRRECAAVGLAGVTFHSMRHSWASWQVQGGTSARGADGHGRVGLDADAQSVHPSGSRTPVSVCGSDPDWR
jgi:integrase